MPSVRSLFLPRAAVYDRITRSAIARGVSSTAQTNEATVATSADGHRLTQVAELVTEQAVRVTFEDGASAKFHKLWLRDHCSCVHCRHPDTRQRQVDTASIPLNAEVRRCEVTTAGGALAIDWGAPVRGTTCTTSEFEAEWLRTYAYALEGGAEKPLASPYPQAYRQPCLTTKKLWAGDGFRLPTHTYTASVDNIEPVMRDLYAYGLVRVADTPSSMDDTEKLATKIGFVLRTIYGTMWTTRPTDEAESYNDTASSDLELLHHTDGTYMREPPGLQIFNCVAQAGTGGASRYVDSFYVAETLRTEDPDAYRVLSSTALPYFAVDTDAHLATMEPLIRVDHAGNIVQFRLNDYDRAPLTHLSFAEVGAFYQAHRKLLEIMRRPEMEFRTKLQVGDMMIVDNQRVTHGRDAFSGGDRALIGCYIGRTEYESRLRVLGII
ncbi:unnamed protein product [Hyaloperonospora brassicae]|uniref:trimethyllysine dioxygenase n=1 Tax=Hyaloperonospora brassicae TaxID=162125 RepID=A0AAV0U5X9_HYABA|nr:unnamed protein product [Hyaloperonospora brassicae]